MDRNIFDTRLRIAAQRALEFAREYVKQTLPDNLVFLVYPNQSYDGNARVGDEVVFPNESSPERGNLGPWSIDEVIAFLWQNGKVPEWIDVTVQAENGERTLIALRCCGRFTAQDDLLYHRPGGLAPFSIKSPVLPPGWDSVEVSGKFDLYWRLQPLDRVLHSTGDA